MNELDELTQQKLQEITRKDAGSLTRTEIEFLAARRSYLNESERKYYEPMFNIQFAEVVEPNLRKSRSYRALQAQAKDLGLKYVGVGRDELERSIDTAVGPR